ncbi:hypothetical protein BRM28_24705 [Xanthomonas oryzae pv. oryzae]|nr:hypothetical protein BRM28_24705 [Xanthomonas oryzae pv. oryzae]
MSRDWAVGIGDWGLGIGDWGLGIGKSGPACVVELPAPGLGSYESPIPNLQFPPQLQCAATQSTILRP